MACYQIEIKATARKQLAQLPKPIVEKVAKLIDKLAENPYPIGYKKIVGSEDTYRIRCGDYRIVYSIFNDKLIVHILKIAHRKEVYR